MTKKDKASVVKDILDDITPINPRKIQEREQQIVEDKAKQEAETARMKDIESQTIWKVTIEYKDLYDGSKRISTILRDETHSKALSKYEEIKKLYYNKSKDMEIEKIVSYSHYPDISLIHKSDIRYITLERV